MKKKIISFLLATVMIASVATVVNAATQIEAGTAITLPEKTLVVDGGFETASFDDPKAPTKSIIPTFTATEDNGKSTERPARSALIITEEGFAAEGKQCVGLASGENLTIALPNLYQYKGAKLVLKYYVRAKAATKDYGTWGKLEDRAAEVPVLDDAGKEVLDEAGNPKVDKKTIVVADFKDKIEYWVNPDNNDYVGKWTLLTEEFVIPDTIAEKNEYVLNFGSYGSVLYYDAVSCVLVTADGAEVDPAVFVEPTPAPTVVPEPTPEAPVTVKFTKKKLTIKKGKKKVLKVKITGATKATFSVNKKKVVKILKKKAKKVTVKGLKKGKAVVTAKVGTKKAKCKITVK